MAFFLCLVGTIGLGISIFGLMLSSYPEPARRDPNNVHSYPPGTKALWDQDAALRGEDPLRGFLLPDGERVRR